MKLRLGLIVAVLACVATSVGAQTTGTPGIGSTIPGPFSAGSLTLTGNINYGASPGTVSGPANAFIWQNNVSSSGVCADTVTCTVYNFRNTSDQVDASGAANGMYAWNIEDNISTAAKGSRNLFDATIYVRNQPAGNGNYVAGAFTTVGISAAAASGSTGLWSQVNQVQIKNTGYGGFTGIEQDMEATAAYNEMVGIMVVLQTAHTTAGSLENIGFTVTAQTNATGTITCAYCIGTYDGYGNLALGAGASLMAFQSNQGTGSSASITNGIHLNAGFTFSGNSFDSPNFAVNGASGRVSAVELNPFASTTTTLSLATSNSAVDGICIDAKATGTGPTLRSCGVDATSVLNIAGAGTGHVTLGNMTNGIVLDAVNSTTTVHFTMAGASVNPILSCSGASPCGVLIQSLNTGVVQLGSGSDTITLKSAITLANQPTTGSITYAVCAASGANGSGGGAIILDTSATICGLSSRRWKDREFDLSSDKALDIAMHLRPETFYFKPGYNEGRTHEQIGFIAEDVALADERLIERDPMGLPRGVSYAQGIPTIAIGAIQNHEARIEALEAKVH